MQFSSLRTKLTVLFVGLLATVQVITFIFVYQATENNVIATTGQQLRYTGEIFLRQVKARAEKLVDNGRLLAKDHGFHTAIVDNDLATIRSTLINLKGRIGADRVMLIDNDYQVITDTHDTLQDPVPFPHISVMQFAEQNDKVYSIFRLEKDLHEFVIVPVKAPVTIAWIGIGFHIDKNLLKTLRSRAPLPVDLSIIEHNHHLKVLETTLEKKYLIDDADFIKQMSSQSPIVFSPRDISEEFMVLGIPLKSDVQVMDNIEVLLQYSLKAAFKPYHSLFVTMVTITLIGLAASVFAGIFLARKLTGPMSQLAAAAKSIEQGDYDCDLNIESEDEIGNLQTAFKTMQSAISVRENEIKHLAFHDQLTNLPNRMLFENTIQSKIREADPNKERFSVVIIGVQSLHEIVNVLGHDVGDQLIKIAGERLVSEIEEVDLLARISSDSFSILLTNCDEENLKIVIDKIVSIFNKPMEVEGNNVDVFINIGAACFPKHSENGKLLIRHADTALYKARQSGEQLVIYDNSLDQYKNHLSLMGELRQGISRNELKLYYQPKIDLEKNKITHVEALVRWAHPERGFMPPDEFIPLAESTGNIHDLTRWALEEAISQSSKWKTENVNIGMAINISANDLLRGNLKKVVAGLLAEYKVNPSMIVFEITESALMENPEDAVRVLDDLKTLGLKISIDDYGTGYSSMEYLKRLPVDELKIDKSFVLDINNNKTDQIIVKSAIELGHDLGLKIIAEGVEDEATVEFLRSRNCDIAQGYYFSKPLSLDELDKWLKESHWGANNITPEQKIH